MSNTIADVNKAQTYDEVIGALRAQAAALTKERNDYRHTLTQYADDGAWEYAEDATDANPIRRKWVPAENGYEMARARLAQYRATTAPETGQGA